MLFIKSQSIRPKSVMKARFESSKKRGRLKNGLFVNETDNINITSEWRLKYHSRFKTAEDCEKHDNSFLVRKEVKCEQCFMVLWLTLEFRF